MNKNNTVLNYNGFIYTRSRKNELGEFVVCKFTDKQQLIEARIVKASSPSKLWNLVRNGAFKNFRILEGSQK